jgi:hypothetical protein
MSMWSKLKVAVLTAAVGLSAMQFGGCLNLDWNTILRYVAIGAIFD